MFVCIFFCGSASALDLSGFSNKDQRTSLKQALTQGAETAVSNLAKETGYLVNTKVCIPLPDSLQKADRTMRKFGMGKYSDELITAMNRTAEAAVPEAKTLLVGAIKKMPVTDAKGILTGGDDAATQYFRSNTEAALAGKFKPIVRKAMDGLFLMMAEQEKAIRANPLEATGSLAKKIFAAIKL